MNITEQQERDDAHSQPHWYGVIREELRLANNECDLHIAQHHNPAAFRARMQNIVELAQRATGALDRRAAKSEELQT